MSGHDRPPNRIAKLASLLLLTLPSSGFAHELPAAASKSWWSAVQRDLSAREYFAGEPKRGVLQAPNRAQDLRTLFTADGVRLGPRTDRAPSWNLGMTLLGLGRGDALEAPPAATLSSNGNRVTCDRGDVTAGSASGKESTGPAIPDRRPAR